MVRRLHKFQLLHFIYSKTNNILFFKKTKNLIKQLKGVKF